MRVQPMQTLRERLKQLYIDGDFPVDDEIVDDILLIMVQAMEQEVSQYRSYGWRTLIEWVRKQ